MRCDVCNKSVEYGMGEKVTAAAFAYLLDNGFGFDEANIKVLMDTGISRSAAEEVINERYRQSPSDWLLCPVCVAKAKKLVARLRETWVAPDYISVTRIAEEVGLGFNILGVPVALSRKVWNDYVEWTDQDTERQIYQEQDARLWDVMFTGSGTLQLNINQFFQNKVHRYSVQCIPRDGISTDAVQVCLQMIPVMIRGQHWIAIEKAEPADSED